MTGNRIRGRWLFKAVSLCSLASIGLFVYLFIVRPTLAIHLLLVFIFVAFGSVGAAFLAMAIARIIFPDFRQLIPNPSEIYREWRRRREKIKKRTTGR